MSLLAVIDIGTNSLRLLIADVTPDPSGTGLNVRKIASERVVSRLGEDLPDTGLLQPGAIDRTVSALYKFSLLINRYKPVQIRACATSALRVAGNSSDLISKVRESSGIKIDIISGSQEAEMTATGILYGIETPERALLLDIGGGSTELILTHSGQLSACKSVNAGAVYLADLHMTSDPPLRSELAAMEEEAGRTVRTLCMDFKSAGADCELIGTAGTITALAALSMGLREFDASRIHNHTMTRDRIRELYEVLSCSSSSERAGLMSFDKSRLDIIVPGTLILSAVMDTLHFDKIRVSNKGLREGILLTMCRDMENRI